MNNQKKILLFGATRNTGYHVMIQALAAGHEVTAIIRNPLQFDYKHPNLKIVKGDALDRSSFEQEVPGKDVIISSLGVTDTKAVTILCSQGVRNMMEAMTKAGVKRIICVSAIALDTNSQMGFFIRTASKVLDRFILTNPYADMRIMEREIKNSRLDWTIVRPPQLKDNPLTGKYREAVGGHLSWPFSIGRADVAHCILKHLDDQNSLHKTIELAY